MNLVASPASQSALPQGQGDNMTCKELTEFLDRYVDNELSFTEKASFKLHLSLCSDCRRYVKGYRATLVLAKNAVTKPDDPVPTAVPKELVEGILASRSKPKP